MDLSAAKPWRWLQIPSLNSGRSSMALVAGGNILYAIGGLAPDGAALDTAEMLDLNKIDQGWKLLKSRMPGKRQSHAAVHVNGVILVSGGKDENDQIIRTIWEYDTESCVWKASEDCARTKLGRISPVMLCCKVISFPRLRESG